jgi:hypothetical protein
MERNTTNHCSTNLRWQKEQPPHKQRRLNESGMSVFFKEGATIEKARFNLPKNKI